MAQLRRDYDQFIERDTAVLVLGPNNANRFDAYFGKHNLPFTGLPDPKYRVLKQYGQEVNLFKLGRMPAQVLVDKNGIARYVHYGKSMRDIPSNEEVLSLVDEMNQEVSEKIR